MNLQEKPSQCLFPRGCILTTSNPSRLCVHHRRFSALAWDQNGVMTQPKRRASTERMLLESESFRGSVEHLKAKAHQFVHVRHVAPGCYEFSFTEDCSVPAAQRDSKAEGWARTDSGNLRVTFQANSPVSEQINEALSLRDAMRVAWGHRNNIFDHFEHYDDPAEFLAQADFQMMFGFESPPSFFCSTPEGQFDLQARIVQKSSGTVSNFYWKSAPILLEEGGVFRIPEVAGMQSHLPEDRRQGFVEKVTDLLLQLDFFSIRGSEQTDFYLPCGMQNAA